MFDIKNNRVIFKHTIGAEKEIVLNKITVGDKFWDATNPYDKYRCLKIEQMLNKCGFKTRMAQNCEDERWSVAIVGEVPK